MAVWWPGRRCSAHLRHGTLQALQELWEPSRSTFAISSVVRSSQQQLITHTMRPTQAQARLTWWRAPSPSACPVVPLRFEIDTIGMQEAMDAAGTEGDAGGVRTPLSVRGMATPAVPEAGSAERCLGRQHALLQPHVVVLRKP